MKIQKIFFLVTSIIILSFISTAVAKEINPLNIQEYSSIRTPKKTFWYMVVKNTSDKCIYKDIKVQGYFLDKDGVKLKTEGKIYNINTVLKGGKETTIKYYDTAPPKGTFKTSMKIIGYTSINCQ